MNFIDIHPKIFLFIALLTMLNIKHTLGAKFPVLTTKTSPLNLRFVSYDGKFSYSQTRKGHLSLIKNFKSIDVISQENDSRFLVSGSKDKKRLIIEEMIHPHQLLNPNALHTLYVVDYGHSKTRKIGMGRYPQLHLQDNYLTFYDMEKIFVANLLINSPYEIKLSKKENPFFIPQVLMISEDIVIYSDINSKGYAGLVSLNMKNKKTHSLLTSNYQGTKFEICSHENLLFVGEFPYEGLSRPSSIKKMSFDHIREIMVTKNKTQYDTIY